VRQTLRLALAAAAVAALTAPAAPASAIYCREPLTSACATLCRVLTTLGEPCPR
jgi:hypothetical protein